MAAVTDVISLDRAKEALGTSLVDPSRDGRLAAMVTAASQYLDEHVGPVVQRTITDEDVPVSSQNGWVQVRFRPVASFSSVVSYAAGAATTLTAETPTVAGTYLAERWPGSPSGLLSGRLRYRLGFMDACWPYWTGVVRASYVAGRFVDTAAAEPTRYGVACQLLVQWMWQSQTLQVAQAGEFDVPFPSFPANPPASVRALLEDEWRDRHPSAIGTATLGLGLARTRRYDDRWERESWAP